ncbi:MAG TPA: lytic transglycosylase domain-containing protein, partial [Chitinophagales bacterium]|nr:lytic transglycosylase domain-containing protein [Chitinophagales bacterium]
FKYMALAESGLRNVISPSNAVGFWQIVESSGRELGLEVNNVVDERYHIGLSTAAACKYLKASHDEFGSWTLAAASYNMGRHRLKRIIREQKVNSYYDLFLNDETSRYVFRILALKQILENAEKYGFYLSGKDLYEPIPCRTVPVENDIDDLAAFALENGTNYKTLKILNPWLRQPYLKVKPGKTYSIQLPS